MVLKLLFSHAKESAQLQCEAGPDKVMNIFCQSAHVIGRILDSKHDFTNPHIISLQLRSPDAALHIV